MDQTNIYNAINFSISSGGQDGPYGFHTDQGLIQSTAFLARVNSFICPSDYPLPARHPSSTSSDTYSQTSYAGVSRNNDIFHWYYGCPLKPSAPSIYMRGDGMFGLNFAYRVSAITHATSNTFFVGEQSRFKNDPDLWLQAWNRGGWFGSNSLSARLLSLTGALSGCPRPSTSSRPSSPCLQRPSGVVPSQRLM